MSERADTLVRLVVERREVKDATEKAAADAKREYKQAEADLWDYLDEENMPSVTVELDGIGKVQIQRRETVRGIVLDKDAAIASIKELDLDEGLLGVEEIRKAPLNEMMKDWLNSGQPIPEGLDFTNTRYVSISRK